MSTSICCRWLAFSTSAQFGALGSAALAIRPCWDLVLVKSLIHSAARSLFLDLPDTPTTEPPRNEGRPLPLKPGIGASATLPLTAVSTIADLSLLGSWCADCTAPSSQPLPYIIAAWPWPKMASWSFSSLVTSPFEYFLTRSAHFFRPSTEADSDSVPFHLSPSFLAIWPPLP